MLPKFSLCHLSFIFSRAIFLAILAFNIFCRKISSVPSGFGGLVMDFFLKADKGKP